VNTAFVAFIYLGQLTGTKAGNTVYENYGGWIASGSLSVAIMIFSLVLVALRGPHELAWVGWTGGWSMEPKQKPADEEMSEKTREGTDQAPNAQLGIAEKVISINTELTLTTIEVDVDDSGISHKRQAQPA
jgi:hypothetical protein